MAMDWEERGRNGRGDYDRGRGAWRGEGGRDWSDRAADEVRSWFGDEDAERRRMEDERRYRNRDHASRGYRSGYADDDYGYGGYGGYADRGVSVGGANAGYPRAYGAYDRGDMYDYRTRGYDYPGEFGYGMGGRYGYGRGRDYESYRGWGRNEGRGFMERAGDEVSSWFGDEDAERRRRMDTRYRGRGPKNYTRSDDRIREDVNDRLSDDPHIDATDIEVAVRDGEVTLDGTVHERFAKRHAEDIAERVSGVKNVQNNLRLKEQRAARTSGTTASASKNVGATTESRH